MAAHDAGKLVRDRIPTIIRADGGKPTVRVLQGRRLLDALLAKVSEESTELAAAFLSTDENRAEHLVEELVDVLEVLNALAMFEGISVDNLMAVREHKLTERGGFTKGFWLQA